MLLRSKMAKLTIRSSLYLNTSNPKVVETVKSCLHEMNRIEENKNNRNFETGIGGNFRDVPKSAPQFHTLCIGSYTFTSLGPAFPIHDDFLYDTEQNV
jgi:hypothetical protein